MKKLILLILFFWPILGTSDDIIDRSKLPSEFVSEIEFYAKLEVVENLSLVENLNDEDLNLAASSAELPADTDKEQGG